MLYDSLTQPKFILVLFLVGFACGFLFDARNMLLHSAKRKKILKNIFDFFLVLALFTCLYAINLLYHYGIFRMFPIFVFFTSVGLQRLISQKFFAKIFAKCYTLFKRKRNGAKKS